MGTVVVDCSCGGDTMISGGVVVSVGSDVIMGNEQCHWFVSDMYLDR